MRRDVALTVASCLLFVVVVLTAFVYAIVRDTGLTDEAMADRGAVILPRPRELAPVNLVNQAGEPWQPTALEGGWTLAYFGFTHCPDICPVALSVMAEARTQLVESGDEPFTTLLVSVDPERDTPETLAEYVAWFDPSFTGVTGTHEQIALLATSVNVAFGKVPGQIEGEYVVDHTGNIVLVNPRGHYHGFLKMPHDATAIAEVLRTLTLRWQQ